MKKASVFLRCMIMVVILTACGVSTPQGTPLLRVMIQPEGSETADYEYLAIYEDGKSGETEPFDPDDADFYTAAYGAFSAQIIDNEVVNTLEAAVLIDHAGNSVEADETMTEILQAAADTIHHGILQLQLIVDGSRYFALVKLNVNLQSPCILYEYNLSTTQLTELCRWDGIDLVGISIN